MHLSKMHRVWMLPFFLVSIAAAAPAQTDVALSFYGAFTGSTTGNGVTQSPANQAGGMVELRHISNRSSVMRQRTPTTAPTSNI